MPSDEIQGRTALLLIDIQNGFVNETLWGLSRSNPSFEKNAALILDTYRSLISSTGSATSSPHKIIHIAHASLFDDSPLHPKSPGYSFQSFAAPKPDELVISKGVNSAFIGTNLEEVLRSHFQNGNGKLFIIGLSTDHCVSTTTRMAGNLWVADARNEKGERGEHGEVILVQDATAAWKKTEDGFDAELVHKVHVESLREFASILNTENTENVVGLWKSWL
ncbi:hypothetical protein V502_00708 [Pseudogymnoascus sp. VKM F-4520 (FW-2644)]|nr:hypothetical protein V502_00708 [Pseudogymnoascus sp. VKM F-4520 (FW-2644)]